MARRRVVLTGLGTVNSLGRNVEHILRAGDFQRLARLVGWWYSVEAEEDLYYRGEEEWLYDFDPDTIQQEITFRLVVPRDPDFHDYPIPDPGFVNDQPLWMGDQNLMVIGSDLFLAEQFKEGIRAISPVYVDDDPCNELITPGRWVTQNRGIANYARSDSYSGWFYIKLVY